MTPGPSRITQEYSAFNTPDLNPEDNLRTVLRSYAADYESYY